MSPNTFDQQVKAARQRLAALEKRAGESTEQGEVLVETLADLSTALEELHVAAEELQHQNEELAATRQDAEAERQRYQDLFDFAPDGYLVTDPQGTIREANRVAATLLGVRREFLVAKPLLVFVAEEEQGAFHDHLTQLQGTVASVQDWQLTLHPRHGAPVPTGITVGAVRGADGRLTGLRWLLRDISERRRVEEERQTLLQGLQDALAKVKTLSGLLPICAWCKRIRDDEGYWNQVEEYISKHSDATISHGICPECLKTEFARKEPGGGG